MPAAPAAPVSPARHLLQWVLALLVAATTVSLAPAPAQAADARQATSSLLASVQGAQVTLTRSATGLSSLLGGVGGLLDGLLGTSLTSSVVTFTDAIDSNKVFALPTGDATVGDLSRVLTFDAKDLTAGLTTLGGSTPTTLPDGAYVVQAVSTFSTGLLGQVQVVSNQVGMTLASATAPAKALPGAPGGISLVGLGDGDALASWTAPTDSGDEPVTGYLVQLFDGATKLREELVTGGQTLQLALEGLSRPVSQVVVTAISSAGTGTPGSAPTSFGIAGAPTQVTATHGNASAVVSWKAADGRGLPVTYKVTSTPGAKTCETTGTSCTVTGLANGTAHTFTVTSSTLSIIPGATSAPSAPVTPSTTPGAPTLASGSVVGHDSATLKWVAPTDDGGARVTGYTVTVAGRTLSTTATQLTVAGLTEKTAYPVTVVAKNLNGSSKTPLELTLTTGAAPRLAAAVAKKATRSGARAAVVRVDLNRASTVVVRIKRGPTVASRTVRLGDRATNVKVSVPAKAKRLLDGKAVTLQVLTTTGTTLTSVKGRVAKARR